MASIRDFKGITGNMTFHEGSGDPVKCAVIVKISDTGQFTFFKQVCPK
jgi:branched-chain amino acid transport system substrate-binding protein